MLAAVAAAGVLVALIVLGVVGLRMQQVRLSYRLDALRHDRAEAEELNRRLRVEKASLQSLARIEGEARTELGMVAPAPRTGAARARVRHGRVGGSRPRSTGRGGGRRAGPASMSAASATATTMTALRTAGLRSRTLIFAACLACAFLGILGRLSLSPDRQARRVFAAGREPARQDRAAPAQARAHRRPHRPGAGRVVGAPSPSSRCPTASTTSRVSRARLAPILGEPAPEIAEAHGRRSGSSGSSATCRPDVAQAVRDLNEPGLGLVEESLRLYPNRELAAHVVGFEGAGRQGSRRASSRSGTRTWPASRAAPSWSATRSAARSPARRRCSRPRCRGRGSCSPSTPRCSTWPRRKSRRRGAARAPRRRWRS